MSTRKLALKGFTLIELLVVIAIIGILATLVITQVASAQVRARNSQAQSDISQAGKAVESFRAANSIDNWAPATASKFATEAVNTAPYTGANVAVAAGAQISGTAAASADWSTSRFTNGAAATSFPVTITKTPGSSYRYGYMTAAAGTGDYCIGTNSVNTSGVTGTVGFIIRDGSSLNATAAEPAWSTWAPTTSGGCL